MSYIWLSKQSQRATMAIASGLHRVSGTQFLGYTTGTEPTHQNYIRQVLGAGEWNRVLSVYFEGFNVPSSDYEFFAGGDNNETNTFFDRDSKHEGTVLLNTKAPSGLGTPIKSGGETESSVAICECELFPDFDNVGNQIDEFGNIVSDINSPLNSDYFFYTVNPANVRVGWLLKYATTYSRKSFDWAKWVAYRDFCGALEQVDYRVIPNLKGFGLTVKFFDSTDFTNEVTDAKRIDPYINFETSSGAPANGLTATAFSATYEDFIKPDFTEEFTFTLQHSDGARLYIDDVLVIDQMGGAGTHTGAADLTQGQHHKTRVDWVNSSGDAELVLKWQSANTSLQVIKTDHYYPMVEQRARYEAHIALISPCTPVFLNSLMDRITNSVTQKINGKYVFECFEQKTIGFNLLESDIIRVDKSGLRAQWERTDNDLQTQSFDVYELTAGDIDDRYLQPFPVPVSYYRDPNNIPENPKVNVIEYFAQGLFSVNLSRWQGYKILKFLMAREVTKDLKVSDLTVTARAYPIQGGDIVPLTIEAAGQESSTFLVLDSQDEPPEKSEERRLTIQGWFPPSEWQQQIELDN